jgi:hypothetical protein
MVVIIQHDELSTDQEGRSPWLTRSRTPGNATQIRRRLPIAVSPHDHPHVRLHYPAHERVREHQRSAGVMMVSLT